MQFSKKEINQLTFPFLSILKNKNQIEQILKDYFTEYSQNKTNPLFHLKTLYTILNHYLLIIPEQTLNLPQIYLENLFLPKFQPNSLVLNQFFEEEEQIIIEIGAKIAIQNEKSLEIILKSSIQILNNIKENSNDNQEAILLQIKGASHLINTIWDLIEKQEQKNQNINNNLKITFSQLKTSIFKAAFNFVDFIDIKAQKIVLYLIISHFIHDPNFNEIITQKIDNLLQMEENTPFQEISINLLLIAFDIYFVDQFPERETQFFKLNQDINLNNSDNFLRKQSFKILQKLVFSKFSNSKIQNYKSWTQEQWKIYFYLFENIETSSPYLLEEHWNRISLLFNHRYNEYKVNTDNSFQNSFETIKLILILFGRGFKTPRIKHSTIHIFLTEFQTDLNSKEVDDFIINQVVFNLSDKIVLKKKKMEIKPQILQFFLSFFEKNIAKRTESEQNLFILKFVEQIVDHVSSPKMLDVYFDFFNSIKKMSIFEPIHVIKFSQLTSLLSNFPSHLRDPICLKYLKSFLQLVCLETLDFNSFSIFISRLNDVTNQFSKGKEGSKIIQNWFQKNLLQINQENKMEITQKSGFVDNFLNENNQYSWLIYTISQQIYQFFSFEYPLQDQKPKIHKISQMIHFIDDNHDPHFINSLLSQIQQILFNPKQNEQNQNFNANILKAFHLLGLIISSFDTNKALNFFLFENLSKIFELIKEYFNEIFESNNQQESIMKCEILSSFIFQIKIYLAKNLSFNQENHQQLFSQFSQTLIEKIINSSKKNTVSSAEFVFVFHSLFQNSDNLASLLNFSGKDFFSEIFEILIETKFGDLLESNGPHFYNQIMKLKSEILIEMMDCYEKEISYAQTKRIVNEFAEILDTITEKESFYSLMRGFSKALSQQIDHLEDDPSEKMQTISVMTSILDFGMKKSEELKMLNIYPLFLFQPKYFLIPEMESFIKQYFKDAISKSQTRSGRLNSVSASFLNALIQVNNDEISLKYIDEIIQIILVPKLPEKKQRNGFKAMDKLASRKEKMDSNYNDKIRFLVETTNNEYSFACVSVFLLQRCKLVKSNTSSQIFINSICSRLFLAFDQIGPISKKKRVKMDDLKNRNKIRVLQLLNLVIEYTSPNMKKDSISQFWRIFKESNISIIRKLVDILGVSLFTLHSHDFITEQHFWDPFFQQINLEIREFGLSSVFIVFHVYQKIKKEKPKEFLDKLIAFLIVSLAAKNTKTRNLARFSIQELFKEIHFQSYGLEKLKERLDKTKYDDDFGRSTKSSNKKFYLENSVCELFDEGMKNLSVDFEKSYIYIPLEIFQQVSDIFFGKESEVSKQIEEESILYKHKDDQNQDKKENQNQNENENHFKKKNNEVIQDENSKNIFQQKISPWEQISNDKNIDLNSIGNEERKKNYESRKKNNLIVCGSLLSKIPNLGGLTRTCEIFNAKMLTVNNINIIKENHFQKISVGAEKWLPFLQVKIEEIPTFFKQKKEEGFVIIGFTESNDSKFLSDFEFPKKCVLLIGDENGIVPQNIIELLDICLEIPHFGFFPSLSPHIGSSIVIWEFISQLLNQNYKN